LQAALFGGQFCRLTITLPIQRHARYLLTAQKKTSPESKVCSVCLRRNPPNLNPFGQIALPNGFCKKSGQTNSTNYNSQVDY
jgi:hypothetical protein